MNQTESYGKKWQGRFWREVRRKGYLKWGVEEPKKGKNLRRKQFRGGRETTVEEAGTLDPSFKESDADILELFRVGRKVPLLVKVVIQHVMKHPKGFIGREEWSTDEKRKEDYCQSREGMVVT